jgi:hypothetical protein
MLGALVLAPLLALVPLAASATPLFQPAPARSSAAVHWNACAPLSWAFDPAGAPAGGFAAVQRAVAAMATASRTRWVYAGRTSAVPTGSYLTPSSGRPVLIGWTDAQHSSLLAGASPKVVAQTQTAWDGGLYTSAVVALNDRTTMALTGGGSWTTTVLHELGHVMGLAHSQDHDSLMYPLKQSRITGLQPVDLEALARLRSCET